MRRDGTILVRFPHIEDRIGKLLPPDGPFHEAVASGGGLYRTENGMDGIVRWASIRPLRDYPLVVSVTRSEPAVLAGWRRQSELIGIGAVIIIAGFLLLFRMLSAQFRRLERSEASLAERNGELSRSACAGAQRAALPRICRNHLRVVLGAERRSALHVVFRLGGPAGPRLQPDRHDPLGMVTEGVTEEQWVEHKGLLAARKPFRDFRYIRTGDDGLKHHISVSGVPIFDETGQFAGYRGAGHEITAQIHAEAALRGAKAEAEDANRQLLEAQRVGKIGHWISDKASRTVRWSPQCSRSPASPPVRR